MLDIVPIDGEYDAGRYGTDARRAIEDVHARGRKSVVCGGTGLYLRSLIYGLAGAPPRHDETRAALQERTRELGAPALHAELALVDPAYAAKIHPNDSVRVIRALEVYQASGRTLTAWHEEQGPPTPQIAAKIVGIAPPRHELYRAIDARVDAMMAQGWLHEVFQILEDGYPPDLKSLGSLGYRHLVAHLQGGPSLEDTIALIKRDHRHYAKRQMTWFRGEPLVTWFTDAEAAFETLVAEEERVK
jgi:tRNA dimethylallyltransferase